MLEPQDYWVLLALGVAFLPFAKRCGREVAYRMEGPRTPEERAADARWNIFVWRIVTGACIGYAGWRLFGL